MTTQQEQDVKLAGDVIDLFVEYVEKHGRSFEDAKAQTLVEVATAALLPDERRMATVHTLPGGKS